MRISNNEINMREKHLSRKISQIFLLLYMDGTLGGCTTIQQHFLCERGEERLPSLENELSRNESSEGYPSNLSGSSLPEIEKYRECEAYASIAKRWSALQQRWAAEKKAAEDNRVAYERMQAEQERHKEAECKNFTSKVPGGRCLLKVDFFWKLAQVSDQYATFVFDAANPYSYGVLAIERNSIAEKSITEGSTLLSFGKCLQETHDEVWKSARGFDIKVKIGRIVSCDNAEKRSH